MQAMRAVHPPPLVSDKCQIFIMSAAMRCSAGRLATKPLGLVIVVITDHPTPQVHAPAAACARRAGCSACRCTRARAQRIS